MTIREVIKALALGGTALARFLVIGSELTFPPSSKIKTEDRHFTYGSVSDKMIRHRSYSFLTLSAAVLTFLIGGIASLGSLPVPGHSPETLDPPAHLRETGLYANFASKTIDPRNLSYSPQYPLWSDGAAKRRWIFLPAETSIDASDPDVWEFPAGTKVWKEFSFHGRRVETRLIASLGGGEWMFASYAWDADESDATLVPKQGLRNVAEIQPGLRHDIPGVLDCKACHVNRRTEILGFSALQLSPDRDPNAPHAERTSSDMVSLQTLIERGLIRSYPRSWAQHPIRIEASNPTARAALGYLHANCGNCHNPNGALETLNMFWRHSVAENTPSGTAVTMAINRTGRFRIPGEEPGDTYLIRPGDPAHSAVLFRMSSRNPFHQMPPLGTKLADADAVSLIRRWILEYQKEERP